jgi:hypothetical protein
VVALLMIANAGPLHAGDLTRIDVKALDERFGFRIGFGTEAR